MLFTVYLNPDVFWQIDVGPLMLPMFGAVFTVTLNVAAELVQPPVALVTLIVPLEPMAVTVTVAPVPPVNVHPDGNDQLYVVPPVAW